MTYFDAAILGFIEGLTEFIPVSSSGHLILAHHFLDLNDQAGGLAFDAVIQLATILAVAVYFWSDLWVIAKNTLRFVWAFVRRTQHNLSSVDEIMIKALFWGTIPAIVFGLLLEKKIETVFRSPMLVACTLIAGAGLMWFAEYVVGKRIGVQSVTNSTALQVATQGTPLTILTGIKIGLYQCLALVPGVSRSGATISGGLLSGLSREEATRFSFLLSFPIIVGSGLKKLIDIVRHGNDAMVGLGHLALGSVIAFLVGLVSIYILIRYLKTHTLHVFIWYRLILAAVVIGVLFVF